MQGVNLDVTNGSCIRSRQVIIRFSAMYEETGFVNASLDPSGPLIGSCKADEQLVANMRVHKHQTERKCGRTASTSTTPQPVADVDGTGQQRKTRVQETPKSVNRRFSRQGVVVKEYNCHRKLGGNIAIHVHSTC